MVKPPSLSLMRRGSELAAARRQMEVLQSAAVPSFASRLAEAGCSNDSDCASSGTLEAERIDILQVNVGKLCNMTCQHCHVDAGPDRREIMTRETVDHCLEAIRDARIGTLDLTGGAPEMNPEFRYFVSSARELGCHVIDRCNLTILLAKGFEDIPQFLAEHDVEVVASLPCYLEDNTDSQRGQGAFRSSLEALRLLNGLGYGQPDSARKLTLVYNPVGPSLPPDQKVLEDQYRQVLRSEYGVEFNRLFTITNMPISRFLEFLLSENRFEEYMQRLVDAYNPAAVPGLMCRGLISVGWDGRLYDCDFNQMLELPIGNKAPRHISEFDGEALRRRSIRTGPHCFGCTAGSGSGCLGSTV